MLAAESVHEFVRPLLKPVLGVSAHQVRDVQEAMAEDGRAALAGEGYDPDAVQFRYGADVRYVGQSSQLTVPMRNDAHDADGLRNSFEKLYLETFGYVADGEPIELVNLRLSALGTASGRLAFSSLSLDARALAGGSGERLVSFTRGSTRTVTRLVPRSAVDEGAIAGPAIIESYDTTVVVPPNCSARAAGSGCIAIDMGANDE
jgi:N-methylhydantoinase A